jgi:hypothetical protein
VLVVDIWHPDFSDEEVRLLSFITNAQMNAAKAYAKQRAATVSDSHQRSSDVTASSAVGAQTEIDRMTDTETVGGEEPAEESGDFFSVIMRARNIGHAVEKRRVWGDALVVDD